MEMIGFVGLGTIGGAIAGNIRRAGYPMMVHDIRPQAIQPLVDGGSRRAESAAEVARHCRVVFTSLPGPPEVEEVALGPNGLLQGIHCDSLYVDLSSSNPDLIRRIAAEFQLRGAQVMDAPLIVGKEGIAKKNLAVLASGAYEAYEDVKPLLDTFGDTVVYAGDLGTGTVIKLAHNLVRRGIGLAIGEGIVLGAKAGVDPQLLWNCMHWGLEVQLHQLAKTFSKTVFEGNYKAPEKTLASRWSWAAGTMCRCPSPLWSSKPCFRLSAGDGRNKAPRPFSVSRRRQPASRCANGRRDDDTSSLTYVLAIKIESGSNGTRLERKGPLMREKPDRRSQPRISSRL
jgi:3-hydroxyisobutyrate dehydrogenase-like beta-hydroxyacid dehydrogenase